MQNGKKGLLALLLGVAVWVCGCSTHIGPPEIQGPPAMVDDDGTPRFWLLTKREESRQVATSTSRRSTSTRLDTFFHFDLQVMDPATARPLWNKRLLTLGDPDAHGYGPSRVIGSAASARLIGQEGERVWLFVDEYLVALRASDGETLATFETIEQANPALKGLLPRETKHYGFDQGLVFMSADARAFVLRGPGFQAQPYAPAPKVVPPPELKANGSPRIAPMLPPMGEIPLRLVQTPAGWLGLYTEAEVADALEDTWGDQLRYPYSITNDGSLARRSFWRMEVAETTDAYGESFRHLAGATPVADSPVLLRGRFLKVIGTEEPRVLENPAGLAVWHVTRIDGDGRLALTRFNEDLAAIWTAELPLADTSTINPVMVWPLEGRLVLFGREESTVDGVSLREPRLVSLSLVDGAWQAWDVSGETTLAK